MRDKSGPVLGPVPGGHMVAMSLVAMFAIILFLAEVLAHHNTKEELIRKSKALELCSHDVKTLLEAE